MDTAEYLAEGAADAVMSGADLSVEPPAAVIDPQFLFELIVGDLHWTSLQIGALAVMASAAVAPGAKLSLHTCRHLVYDDTRAVRLALRYGEFAGLAGDLILELDRLYAEIGEAQKQTATFVAPAGLSGSQREQLSRFLPRLRRNAQAASQCLGKLEAASRALHPNYADDNVSLRQFLARAARGDLSDLDRASVFAPPRLKQRRSLQRVH